MKSLVFWYETKPNSNVKKRSTSKDVFEHKTAELQLHLNHWKLKVNKSSNTKANEYLLDLGIRIKDGKEVEKVCFFLPEEISDLSQVIDDLGIRLKDDKILTAVFNESYSYDTVHGEKYFVAKDGREPVLNIYTLDILSDLSSEIKFGGTVIKLPFKHFNEVDTYYRLRLKTKFVKNFSSIYKPKVSFIESAFSSIELIDLRINDTRDINLSLLENIRNTGKWFKISLIHLFVMRNLTDEYILSDIRLNSIRQLEEGIWLDYIGDSNYKYEKSIAYHLKAKASIENNVNVKFIEDYNALIKFRFEDRHLKFYFLYILLFALGTAVIGNALFLGLAELIYWCVKYFKL